MLQSSSQLKFVYHHYSLVFKTFCLSFVFFFSLQLAKYCDSILKKSTKNLSDAELDEKLTDIVSELLREITLSFPRHKTIFQDWKQNHLDKNVIDKEGGRGSMIEWLERWTCYMDSASSNHALTASWICSWQFRVQILARPHL